MWTRSIYTQSSQRQDSSICSLFDLFSVLLQIKEIDKQDSLISRVMILKATEGNNSEHWRHFLN